MIANGIVDAVKELDFKLPLVVRFQGTNAKEGKDKINNSDLGLSKISQLAFSGQPNKVSINLNRMFAEGVNPVAVVRTMLNYVQRIQITQITLKKTNDFESAIKSLKPPVFWKDKDSFKLHCKKWPIKETVLNFNLLNSLINMNIMGAICEQKRLDYIRFLYETKRITLV